MTKKKIATFTTVTDYQQEFEICLNDIWDDYIADQEKAFNEPFDDEGNEAGSIACIGDKVEVETIPVMRERI